MIRLNFNLQKSLYGLINNILTGICDIFTCIALKHWRYGTLYIQFNVWFLSPNREYLELEQCTLFIKLNVHTIPETNILCEYSVNILWNNDLLDVVYTVAQCLTYCVTCNSNLSDCLWIVCVLVFDQLVIPSNPYASYIVVSTWSNRFNRRSL